MRVVEVVYIWVGLMVMLWSRFFGAVWNVGFRSFVLVIILLGLGLFFKFLLV